MVDASVGGKTGINFNGLKNEIGVFKDANTVFIDTIFLKTLDHQNILSGYAEMLKHSLISDDKIWARHLLFDFDKLDLNELSLMIADSIELKRRIVTEDPHENGECRVQPLSLSSLHTCTADSRVLFVSEASIVMW